MRVVGESEMCRRDTSDFSDNGYEAEIKNGGQEAMNAKGSLGNTA
jgi:hypothetical protein